ncbi:hypothetical protein [Brachybacterium paraconglomeratum]|uniref:hypothetical protein n=1 Tax=Brachybacterium paraconglomeratum TaxID=173362 RepID=UPI0024937A79|nr:hypothetical protein [Brachybacterium paraconglomeratum]
MTQRVVLMHAGWAAPESGPFRDEYLRANGVRFLQGAQAAIAAVAEVLDGHTLPVVHLTGDENADRAQVGAAVRRWAEIREEFAEVVEARLREPIEAAVGNAVDALNFLEDTELCQTAHDLVHQAAWLRFGFLGCELRVEDGSVQSDCPVRIAHLRWGFSPEIKAQWACSICNERFDKCPHIPDDEYEVVVDRSDDTCSACLEETCHHQDGERVVVPARRVATDMSAIAIALVARPRDPRARIASLPLRVPTDSEFFAQCENGEGRCTACILPCTGFIEFDAEP